jgi:hypothetical protein
LRASADEGDGFACEREKQKPAKTCKQRKAAAHPGDPEYGFGREREKKIGANLCELVGFTAKWCEKDAA